MLAWNFATVWETIADSSPDAPALVQGERTVSWRDFDRRADGLARYLLDAGAGHQDKVALYLYNCPEYLEACFALLQGGRRPGQHQLPLRRRRAGLPVGQRRRGGGRVPRHLRRAHRTRPRPRTRGADLVVGRRRPRRVPVLGGALRDGGGHADGAGHAARRPGPRRPVDDLHRRHHRHAQGRDVAPGRPGAGRDRRVGQALPGDGRLRRSCGRACRGSARSACPACPLMHATGWFSSLGRLCTAGCVALARGPSLPRRRPARRLRAPPGEHVGHRRRRHRQAAARRARRQPRPLGPVRPPDAQLVGGDVVGAGEGGAAPSPAQRAPHRQLRLLGGDGHGPGRVDLGRVGADGHVQGHRQHQGARRRLPGGPTRVGRGGAGGGTGPPAVGLLQGSRQVRTDLRAS